MDAPTKEFMKTLFEAYDPEMGELLDMRRRGEGSNCATEVTKLENEKLREDNLRLKATKRELEDVLDRMRVEHRRLTEEADTREEAHEREVTGLSDELTETQDALEVRNITRD